MTRISTRVSRRLEPWVDLEYERKIVDPKLGVDLLVQFADRVEYDLLGLERVREISKALICFVVVDLSRAETFEFAKNVYLPQSTNNL